MGVGLGKNSPVVLSLGKENYEALITRHGQWVRWRTATVCNCVDAHTQQPNIHCKKCGGRGYLYSHQKSMEVWQSVLITDNTGIIELYPEYENCTLKKVYNFDGTPYPEATKNGRYISLNTDNLPNKSSYLNIVMDKPLENFVQTTSVEKIGMGFYKLPDLSITRTGIDGIYYRAPSDILSIDKVSDENGQVYTVKELRLNMFYIEPNTETLEDGTIKEIPIGETITVEGVKYIDPFIFVLLSQNLSNKDVMDLTENKGDAMLTFPYSCDVAQKDVVTVLAGTYTQKDVIVRSKARYDTLQAYFVDEIKTIVGEREYINGVDYLLVGTNYIKWIAKDSPKVGDNYSITYKAFPSYVVMKDIPQIRTSENQRIPKKAVVKFVGTYSEMINLNKQGMNNNDYRNGNKYY